MSFWSEADLAAALRAIDLETAADPKFKQLALIQPRQALEKVSGRQVPPGPLLTIIDYDLAYDTAPVVPALSRAQRRRADLEEIAALFLPESESGKG